jgi:hypothetical protein
MSAGACPAPAADTSPRGRERTHPDRVSVVRNEVTPSGPGPASRDAARWTDARAGTGFPKKQTLPAARQRATGQIGLRGPTRKGADVGEAPEGRNGRRSPNRQRKLDAACGPASGAGGEQSRRSEVRSTCRGAGSRVLGNLHARIGGGENGVTRLPIPPKCCKRRQGGERHHQRWGQCAECNTSGRWSRWARG